MFEFFKKKVKEVKACLVTALTAGVSAGMAMPAFASGADSPGAGSLDGFLDTGSTVFGWLIEEMGTLISFILTNPFMQVVLVLFICGAVIGFFARIRSSI